MKARLTATAALAAGFFLCLGSAAAIPPVAPRTPASANALAVKIVAPDLTVVAQTSSDAAPPSGTIDPEPFVYPPQPQAASIVSTDTTSVAVTASALDGTAAATTDVKSLSIFEGEITADDVRAVVSSAGTVGDLSESAITHLVVLGTPVTARPNETVPLADWGHATVLAQSARSGPASLPSWYGTITALVVHLDADHGGLEAGSEIRVGFADAYSRPPAPAATTATAPEPSPPTTEAIPTSKAPVSTLPTQMPAPLRPSDVGGATSTTKKTTVPKPKKPDHLPRFRSPLLVTPKLTAGGYVFPVYGPSGYGDTFGAARADVSGGWHHGDDIFAALGAPILAVADGTVFSVGWNDVGGYRLWLRDGAGNEFYYAHLSAYTRLAVNGRHVKAGQVLGFVGNTGDAQGTPFHLHFEVHPVSMLFLGYDGAVDPTTYLDAWKRLEDVRILPAVPFQPPQAARSNAPAPGAILLQSSDISTASGLDPGSLRRALRAPSTVDLGHTPVGQLPSPLPVLDRA